MEYNRIVTSIAAIHDDMVIWSILAIMFSTFIGVVYIAYILMSRLKDRYCPVS